MNPIPCRARTFPYRTNASEPYTTYLRWFRHLCARLGVAHTLAIWQTAFAAYDDTFLVTILSSGWQPVNTGEAAAAAGTAAFLRECIAAARPDVSPAVVKRVLAQTPPIPHIRQRFQGRTVQKELSAYEALHLRFDGLAHLAETLVKEQGKQGEFIVYDLMVAGRLLAAQGQTGSAAEFMAAFTAVDETPSLFTAGLQSELIRKSDREAVVYIRECEWARYFRERHPSVGYLMACSTDEVAYQAFNASLRLQRTTTLMEGGDLCDFRVYAVGDDPAAA